MNGYFTVGLLVIVAGSGAYAYVQHRVAIVERSAAEAARSELSQYQASAVSVINERLEAEKRQAEDNDRRASEIQRANQDQLGVIAARYERRLRNSATATSASRVSAATGETGAAGDVDVGTPEQRFIAALRRCEETTAQLAALQRWLRETH